MVTSIVLLVLQVSVVDNRVGPSIHSLTSPVLGWVWLCKTTAREVALLIVFSSCKRLLAASRNSSASTADKHAELLLRLPWYFTRHVFLILKSCTSITQSGIKDHRFVGDYFISA